VTGPLYRFSATFYEGKPSLIKLRYFNTTDQGRSASIGMQGYYEGRRKSSSVHNYARSIANGVSSKLRELARLGGYSR
jgi:hypothetical protein